MLAPASTSGLFLLSNNSAVEIGRFTYCDAKLPIGAAARRSKSLPAAGAVPGVVAPPGVRAVTSA